MYILADCVLAARKILILFHHQGCRGIQMSLDDLTCIHVPICLVCLVSIMCLVCCLSLLSLYF